METKDYIIYKGIANAAARVFENVICPAGEYTAKDIAKEILIHFFYKDEFYNNRVQENEKITVEFDGYKCSFPIGSVFDVCAQIETAWEIPSARRAKFVRKAETRPVAVAFDVPAAAKEIIKAIPAKFDNLRPVMNYVCIDTRRRCLIAGAANVLTAVAVPNMYVSEDAKETYLIDPLLMKSGKGTIFVDEENSVNGTQTRPNYKDRNFPSWERILPAVQDAQRINITPAVWKQLKKEITAAAKFSDNAQKLVEISGRSGCPEITVNYLRIFETAGKENSRAVNINLPQPCPFDFSVQINGKQFAAVPAADSMYIYRNAQTGNVSICFAAAGAVSYLPNLDEDKDVNAAAVPAFEDAPDAAKNLLSVAAFPEIGTANSPAAAALIAAKDEETPAADSAKETRPSWEQTLPAAAVSFAFDETPAVSEDAQETAANVQDETPAVFAKVDEYAVNDENGNAVIFETYAPQLGTDEETAAPVPEDAQETPAADSVPADSVPAANDIETLINNKFAAYLNAAPAAAVQDAPDVANVPAADSVPAVDEETAPAVQDEETAANVETPAVSLPVPVAAVYPLHAVYIDNVLHGVYFSKLLADEIFWNAFFAGRSVYPLQILSNETAPETESAAVPVAVSDSVPAVDEETAPTVQDEETAAPADSVPAADPFASVWACMQETPAVQDAPAVPVDEETPAVLFSVPEDAQETAANVQDEETPAVLIAANFARRFRRVWQTAAAVLFLIICAAVPVAVSDSVPADSVPAVLFAADSLANVPAVSVPEDEETANVQDETAPAVQDAPDVANAAPADSVPAVAKKQPQPRRKRARRAVSFAAVPVAVSDSVPADSCKQFAAVPVAVSDSVPADSVPAVLFAADSLANVPAVDAPAVAADSVPADSCKQDAPAVQDAPDVANAAPADSVPAVDEETAPAVQDEETPAVPEDAPAAPADSVPADSVPAANSPAPAVPAVQCAPAAPVAPVAPIVIACFGN